MSIPHTFIFDFDSTITPVESLDEIIRLSVNDMTDDEAERQDIMAEIERITDSGMNGDIDLSESIKRRLMLARVHERHVHGFNERFRAENLITQGMDRLIANLQAGGSRVMIVSGGLKHCLDLAAELLGLPAENVYGNDSVMDSDGFFVGVKRSNPLSITRGKAVLIKQLKEHGVIPGPATIIGDGISDYRPYELGIVDHFVGFGMHKLRPEVEKLAPAFARTMDELASQLVP